MIVGVPREIKEEENRVALTPSGVGAIVAHGHRVLVEHGAGAGSRLPDARYREAGAELADARTVWTRADLVLKVKEPQPSEYAHLRPDLVLFTYLHLAANPALTRVVVDPAKLRYVHDILGGHVTTVMSNRANLEEEVVAADLVVGSVLIPGARTPRLLSRALVGAMRPGAALVDLSIDQGGCAETSRP